MGYIHLNTQQQIEFNCRDHSSLAAAIADCPSGGLIVDRGRTRFEACSLNRAMRAAWEGWPGARTFALAGDGKYREMFHGPAPVPAPASSLRIKKPHGGKKASLTNQDPEAYAREMTGGAFAQQSTAKVPRLARPCRSLPFQRLFSSSIPLVLHFRRKSA
jgi:hypothetical protein